MGGANIHTRVQRHAAMLRTLRLPPQNRGVWRRVCACVSSVNARHGHEAGACRALPRASAPLGGLEGTPEATQAGSRCGAAGERRPGRWRRCLRLQRAHVPEGAPNPGACGAPHASLCHCRGGKNSPPHPAGAQNFALVEEQVVRFTPGLNVITGASGSGKSVLVRLCLLVRGVSCLLPPYKGECEALKPRCSAQMDAIAQLCGAPMLDEHVRPPADSASLEVRRWWRWLGTG